MILANTGGPVIPGFAAIVLAGGRSERMGRDKTRLLFGGVPLIERVLAAIRPLFTEVIVAGGVAGRFADLPGIKEVGDSIPDAGPLAGIRAGLVACAAPWAFVVAADMPNLDPTLIRRVTGLAAADVELVLPRQGPYVEPLHAAYHRDLVGAIDLLLHSGERRPRLL
ncbi:MAG TPA: molybdenum cofactor guanylyltransferase, partial [Polyangia bacterium]|nr:molybdenum cofactor guanylyltransferase [Polyangia bacterium]